jgi:regulator of protease activity HflC (stomatin/prohibitin superfamily)
LDEADRKEVHHFARAAKRMNVVIPYEALPILDNRPVFNPDRVFAAVSSQARDDENALVPWLNLPTHVAIDFFREIIGQVNFDDLYNTDDPAAFPMEIYKHQQKMVMRFNGLISYRVVYFANGRSLGSGAEFGMDEIQVSTVQPLRNPKVLRERGIKVISSQFGDIRAPDRVFQQRLEAWRARWLRDTEIVRGRYEQEAMSIRSAAQAEAQRDLYSTFARLYQDNVLNQEAIVIRVFQALERAASDPGTRNQLTPGTVQMMQALGRLILPRENRQGYED